FQAGPVLIDNRLHDRIVLGNGLLHLVLDVLVETLADGAQTLADLGRTEEVELQPGDAELLFHHLAHVVHGAVAVDQVELHRVRGGDLLQLAVAGPDRLDIEADLLQQSLGRPDIAADVVVADKGNIVRSLRLTELASADNVIADGVVGDVVAEGLGNAAEPLAVAGDDRQIQLGSRMFGSGVDVVTDESDRTLGQHRDPLGQREQTLGLNQQLLQLLVAAVDNILLLEIGGELHGELVYPELAGHQIAPGTPGVPAAADRAVGNMDHVADRSPDDPFGACVGAAAGTHDAGNGLLVGLDCSAAGSLIIGAEMRSALLLRLLGINLKSFGNQLLGRLFSNSINLLYRM